MARELRCAVDRVRDGVHVSAPAILSEVAATKQLGRTLDDGEQVVEVVRHPAGELTDGLHLLRLTQSLFGLGPLGDPQGPAVG